MTVTVTARRLDASAAPITHRVPVHVPDDCAAVVRKLVAAQREAGDEVTGWGTAAEPVAAADLQLRLLPANVVLDGRRPLREQGWADNARARACV